MDESPSKVPQWLEEISHSIQRHNGGKWNLSEKPEHKKSKSARLPKKSEFAGVPLDFSGTETLGGRISSHELKVPRSKSASYGRRSSVGPWSAGNSPRGCGSDVETDIQLLQTALQKQLEFEELSSSEVRPSLEESWNSLSFFDHKHKGRLTKIDIPTSSDVPTFGDVPILNKETKENSENVGKHLPTSEFIIPELPGGIQFTINIKSTWGDRHYLGLNGIEIFSENGEPVKIRKIWADPADINVLPEYGKDPRVIANVLDGVNRTHDDMHLWLAPFTPGSSHFVYIRFAQYTQVAMIRIWNYNKSRIHSFRGVRDVEITLDNVLIFQGEIARASGGILGDTEAFGDTILFTTDDNILESISQCDDSFNSIVSHSEIEENHESIDRPLTADTGEERPFTCAQQLLSCSTIFDTSRADKCITGCVIEIDILQNWGHPALIVSVI